MPNKVHALKILPELFALAGKQKPFEVRKDDRGFNVGDTLWLQEWEKENGYTGKDKKFNISYVLRGEEWGIIEGYCVLGLDLTPTNNLREVDGFFREARGV